MIEKTKPAFDIPKSELLTWTEPCLRRVLWTRDSRFDTVYDLSFNFLIKKVRNISPFFRHKYVEIKYLSLYRPLTDINQVKPDFMGSDEFFGCILKLFICDFSYNYSLVNILSSLLNVRNVNFYAKFYW